MSASEQLVPAPVDGFRGVWYAIGAAPEPYRYKYSGGLGTYPQQVGPIAVHCPEVGRTYFAYGGASPQGHVRNMFSWLDHVTGRVRRPVVIHDRDTNNAHFNASLAVDEAGYIYVFANSHGLGGLDDSPQSLARRESVVYRSSGPHDPSSFEVVRRDNFSYSQPWPRPGGGLLWLHTRYQQVGDGVRRVLYYASSGDDAGPWQPERLVDAHAGSYQVSWSDGTRVVTAFDVHPTEIGVDARSGLHVLEIDLATGQVADHRGQQVRPPVLDPAQVCLREHAGSLVFLKDVAFDDHGAVAILYLTSAGAAPGPASGPRAWRVVYRAAGQSEWRDVELGTSSHNYDHGTLTIDGSNWLLTAPLEPGPQQHATGGTVVTRRSSDAGETWKTIARVPAGAGNHTYVRKPYRASSSFSALWADGDALELSSSSLYLGRSDGAAFRLPQNFEGEWATPERVARA